MNIDLKPQAPKGETDPNSVSRLLGWIGSEGWIYVNR